MKAIFSLLVIVIFITQRTCSGQCQPCQDKATVWIKECETKFYGDCIKTFNECSEPCKAYFACINKCANTLESCEAPHFSDYDACVQISNWALSDCIGKTCP